MTKQVLPLIVADISPFARALSKQLKAAEDTPSHLSLLNMLARAAGFRNVQHMRASRAVEARLRVQPQTVDYRKVEKALHQFDKAGCLPRWPGKRSVQELCLWVMWSTLPAGQVMEERDVNGLLNRAHGFDDAAILRRSLIGMRLLAREPDGSDYRRIEQAPPPEAVALIREVSARRE